MRDFNLPMLVIGLCLIVLGCIIFDGYWPEPDVFEPVEVTEVVEVVDSLDELKASCVYLREKYISLYDTIQATPAGGVSDEMVKFGLQYLVMGHTQYQRACSDIGFDAKPIPDPVLPLQLTI